MSGSFLDLLAVNHGHFKLESGMHGDVWFDLEKAYAKPKVLESFVARLGHLLAPYEADAICGALAGGALIGYSIAHELEIDFMYTERFERSLSDNEREVEYWLPKEFQRTAIRKKVAIVDDVINAGSAVLKTYNQLVRFEAQPIVMASLLTVGGSGPKRLPGNDLPIVTLGHLESNLWQPPDCPLCVAGEPLVDPYDK